MSIACHPGYHVHDTAPQGGRCAFYSPGRPGGICGRAPVAVYINERAPVRLTYRCRNHDLTVAAEAAAELGFRRVALDTKAARVAALDRRWARGES